ncbi:MAG: GDP-mannose 4,6-dehydratase [Verrucomicrobia bacterium]|nr:GDP-mannose 4,6-dehydratase [Verrucomicrobiota bacterium]
MRIGITGGRGTLGKILQEQLSADEMAFDCFAGDICRPEDLRAWLQAGTFDAVVHFAALVPTQSVQANPARAFQVNVGGTANLVAELGALAKKPWLFYASSSHVYQPQAAPISESAPVVPINPYGLSKRLGEQVVEASAGAMGVPYCIGRIFSFYHPTQTGSFLYPSLQQRFATEDLAQPFRLFGADDIRDLSLADDLVAHIRSLLAKQATGLVNVGSGRGTKISDFVQSLAPLRLQIVNASEGTPTSLVADTSRLRQLLGS